MVGYIVIGVVVLLDERFLQRSYTRLFPVEWSDYETVDKDNAFDKIERFWDQWVPE